MAQLSFNFENENASQLAEQVVTENQHKVDELVKVAHRTSSITANIVKAFAEGGLFDEPELNAYDVDNTIVSYYREQHGISLSDYKRNTEEIEDRAANMYADGFYEVYDMLCTAIEQARQEGVYGCTSSEYLNVIQYYYSIESSISGKANLTYREFLQACDVYAKTHVQAY